MKRPHLITKIRDVKGYTILVEFDGEEVRAVDLSRLVSLRPSFRRLKDPKTFSQCEVTQDGSLVWFRDIEITGPTLYHMGEVSDLPNL